MDLEHAEDLLRQGRYPEAIDRFRELLSQDPDRAELRGRVAEAYRLAGNQERAFHHFHRAAALFLKGRDLLGAARMLEAANQVSPNEPEVLFRLGEVLKRLGKERPLQVVLRNLVKAASAPGDRRRLWALEELAALHPQEVEVQVELAVSLAEVGRPLDAVARWRELAGQLARRGYDPTPRLVRVAELAPDQPAVGVQVAQLLLRGQRAREALAVLVPYYEKFPDDVEVLEALLAALIAMDARDKVLPARLELLKARTRLGQRAVALEEIKALLAAQPHDPRVLEVSAHACAAFGLVGEACRLWFELAELYERHGMGAERDRVVLLILKSDPSHTGALGLGARVLRGAGRVAEAESLERRLDDLVNRSHDSMEVVPEDPGEPTGPGDPTTQGHPHGRGTVVISDADVLDETQEVQAEDMAGISDVFDARTPAEATRAGSSPFGRPPSAGARREAWSGYTPRPPGRLEDPFFLETDRGAPLEAPETPEEATQTMERVMSAELDALRAELDEDDVTATDLNVFDTEPPPKRSPRPSPRLVSDLLDEVARRKG
jgi:tetratricopeptide (TPR) repeat protein